MEPIKARGERIDNDKIITGQVIKLGNRLCIIDESHEEAWYDIVFGTVEAFAIEIKPETLGYATGIKNKANQEFYTGDIIRDLDDDEAGYGTVKFDKQDAMFGFSLDNCWYDFSYATDTLEVIGNIHQNPELLEEK